jgi:hypothetical protein
MYFDSHLKSACQEQSSYLNKKMKTWQNGWAKPTALWRTYQPETKRTIMQGRLK